MDQRTGGTPGVRNNGDVGAKTREIAEQAEAQLAQLRERMGEINERVVGFIRERPGTAILIALGAGYLIGRMLRS